MTNRSRIAVIKARVVRHGTKRAPLSAHLTYLSRDGVTKDGDPARMFGAGSDDVDHTAFAEQCEEDRHHFRFIVSPDDAVELSDIKAFTRDLGTRLDWAAIDHWNTEHPHVHVIVRGQTDDNKDLVISRDYIREGMRARAQQLLTLELGPDPTEKFGIRWRPRSGRSDGPGWIGRSPTTRRRMAAWLIYGWRGARAKKLSTGSKSAGCANLKRSVLPGHSVLHNGRFPRTRRMYCENSASATTSSSASIAA
jgi:hypothetical protein